MTKPTIPVAEVFGPTLQGEGALAGRPTYFLRVGGCDFKCLWCDSAHAVNPTEVRKLDRFDAESIGQTVVGFADAMNPKTKWLTISGGNPAMYDLRAVADAWHSIPVFASSTIEGIEGGRSVRRKVAVETQGSKWAEWLGFVDLITVSPKPPSSGMTHKYGVSDGLIGLPKLQAFLEFHANSQSFESFTSGRSDPSADKKLVLKVVVFDETDYEFARALHIRYPDYDFYLSCGTAMGGLSGKWVPPAIPDLNYEAGEVDIYKSRREHPSVSWADVPSESNNHLLRRYRWLADRVKDDPAMADVAAFPQLHALTWGIDTIGV